MFLDNVECFGKGPRGSPIAIYLFYCSLAGRESCGTQRDLILNKNEWERPVLFLSSPHPSSLALPKLFLLLTTGVGGAQSRLPEIVKRKCYHVDHTLKSKRLQTESAPSIPIFLLLALLFLPGRGKIDKG